MGAVYHADSAPGTGNVPGAVKMVSAAPLFQTGIWSLGAAPPGTAIQSIPLSRHSSNSLLKLVPGLVPHQGGTDGSRVATGG